MLAATYEAFVFCFVYVACSILQIPNERCGWRWYWTNHGYQWLVWRLLDHEIFLFPNSWFDEVLNEYTMWDFSSRWPQLGQYIGCFIFIPDHIYVFDTVEFSFLASWIPCSMCPSFHGSNHSPFWASLWPGLSPYRHISALCQARPQSACRIGRLNIIRCRKVNPEDVAELFIVWLYKENTSSCTVDVKWPVEIHLPVLNCSLIGRCA